MTAVVNNNWGITKDGAGIFPIASVIFHFVGTKRFFAVELARMVQVTIE